MRLVIGNGVFDKLSEHACLLISDYEHGQSQKLIKYVNHFLKNNRIRVTGTNSLAKLCTVISDQSCS